MALPQEPISLGEPMDPADLVDYIAEFTLEEGTAISSFTLALLPEAALKGVSIREEVGQYEADVVASLDGVANSAILFWLEVNVADREDPTFSGSGMQVGVVATVTTTATPPRRKQRTYVVTVRQR